MARAGQAFRRLHNTAAPFATDFRLFPMIDEYKTLLASKGATLPDGYDDVQRQAEVGPRRARGCARCRSSPCHCDPLCENFLDTGERMYIIDYEYAGNNDPMWDLGDLSVEGEFAAEQDDACCAPTSAATRRPTSAVGWSPTRHCATCCGRCGA